jgi:hypothetical protein
LSFEEEDMIESYDIKTKNPCGDKLATRLLNNEEMSAWRRVPAAPRAFDLGSALGDWIPGATQSAAGR